MDMHAYAESVSAPRDWCDPYYQFKVLDVVELLRSGHDPAPPDPPKGMVTGGYVRSRLTEHATQKVMNATGHCVIPDVPCRGTDFDRPRRLDLGAPDSGFAYPRAAAWYGSADLSVLFVESVVSRRPEIAWLYFVFASRLMAYRAWLTMGDPHGPPLPASLIPER